MAQRPPFNPSLFEANAMPALMAAKALIAKFESVPRFVGDLDPSIWALKKALRPALAYSRDETP